MAGRGRNLTSEEAREMNAARQTRAGRKPGPAMPCGWCGSPIHARAMRKHFTECPKRPYTIGPTGEPIKKT